MSDIFQEVDEEVRRERLQKLWEKYGMLVVAACVVLVAAVGGWRAYDWHQTKQAAEAGVAYEAAAAFVTQGKHEEAAAAFAKLSADAPSNYRMLARLREAAELGRRDAKSAVAIYDALAADSSVPAVLRELASVRAGILLVDTAPFDEIRQRLEPQTAQDKTFRHSARAAIAMAAWRAKDTAAVKRWSDMILSDRDTPDGTRGQIEILMALSSAEAKS
ncbi:MAG: tetratricopeptide repeat protein [Alphaproteobacteria bacterium]|nr:tetratricopeptide repeat protein [Alphaproteobacteria bacterium]